MIHRLQRGIVPDKPHTAFEVDGRLVYEHCTTRKGFEGIFTIQYHRRPPHWVERAEPLGRHPGWAEPRPLEPLRRCHYLTSQLAAAATPFLGRRLLMANADIGVWVGRPSAGDATLVANADGDELSFIHAGSGRLECPLGVLRFAANDYVYVPQGMPWYENTTNRTR